MSAEEESKAQEGQAPKPDAMEMQALQAVLNSRDAKRAAKEKYAFWETQPVAQFKEMAVEVSVCERAGFMHTCIEGAHADARRQVQHRLPPMPCATGGQRAD